MVRYGMTPMQAIQAATTVAAALLDMGDNLGSIEPGKFADIVAVPGDPLADINSTGAGPLRDEGRPGL